MGRRIPHLKLHRSWCRYPDARLCSRCLKRADVLHHDHIMDFALEVLRVFAPTPKEALVIWQCDGAEFRPFVRFDPVRLCARCNGGDGGGKTAGWCGVRWQVYPKSFSMTPDELAEARSVKGAKKRRAKADDIWRRAARCHIARRKGVIQKAIELVALAESAST